MNERPASSPHRLIGIGGLGVLVFGVCCFTPLLVVVFGLLGVSAALAWADYVLLPAMFVSAAMLVVGLVRWRSRRPGRLSTR